MNIKNINVVINIIEYIVAILKTAEYFTDQTKSAINNINRNTAFRKRLESLKKEYKNIASVTIKEGDSYIGKLQAVSCCWFSYIGI